MRPVLKGTDLTGWTVPRYKPIVRCRIEEMAREKILKLIAILEEQGLPTDEIEHRVFVYREESLAGLNYQRTLLEEEFGIEREEAPEPRVRRVKRTKRVKKKKKERGGFFTCRMC